MKTTSGIITLVQEHRFQLENDDGGHRLFVLTHDAPVEWRDLKAMEEAQCRVAIRFEETGSTSPHAAAAHDVQPL